MIGSVIKDLSDWAEDRFSGLCAAAGVTRNKSTQDRSGWDYIIQFPSPETPGVPADMLPGEDSARVQVKSKEKGRPTTSMKLTNALRFAKDPAPCFLILFLASNQCEPVRIYAKHFWVGEMEAALRRARLADQQGRTDLHKIMLSIRFEDKDDHSTDLLSWIAATIRAKAGRYAETKSALGRNLGFEDGFIHGTISFAAEDLGALVDHQIGLTSAAPITDITIKQRRFGIDARKPIFSGKPDFTHLRSHPAPCRVRIRTFDGADIWLEGDLFLPTMAGVPLELRKLRVVADFLEIIISGSREGSVNFAFNGTDQRTIPGLRALIDVARRAENGPLNIQISSEGRPNLPVTVAIPSSWDKDQLQQLSNVVACLEAVTAGILPTNPTLSFVEIYAAWNAIVAFNGLVTGTDLHGKFKLELAPDRVLSLATSIYLYDYVDIGAWTFMAVVRRPITQFTMDGSRGKFHCGVPRVVEALVRRGKGAAFLTELGELYRQSVGIEKVGVLELYGGDYRAMLAASESGAVGIKTD